MPDLWNLRIECMEEWLFVAELIESAVSKCFETKFFFVILRFFFKRDSRILVIYVSFETVSLEKGKGEMKDDWVRSEAKDACATIK